jgi:hypothetical protein
MRRDPQERISAGGSTGQLATAGYAMAGTADRSLSCAMLPDELP